MKFRACHQDIGAVATIVEDVCDDEYLSSDGYSTRAGGSNRRGTRYGLSHIASRLIIWLSN